jgi:hypothetical protein
LLAPIIVLELIFKSRQSLKIIKAHQLQPKEIRMQMKSMLSACALALAFAVSAPVYAADEVSMHEVYRAAESGRIAEAQSMMDKVLREHPDSAKAHYVEAELLAKQDKLSAASVELQKAESLKPGLPFAKPQSVQELKAIIAGQGATSHAAPANQSGISGAMIFLGIALIVFIFFVGRAMGRRNNPVVYPAGNYNGNNGMPMGGAPYGGAPMGGGMGSGIMGGLATGAALGAGMVAGEALMHNVMGDGSHNNGMVSDANANDTWDTPSDMGGNDFGVTDSGSWDDGGGGDWT